MIGRHPKCRSMNIAQRNAPELFHQPFDMEVGGHLPPCLPGLRAHGQPPWPVNGQSKTADPPKPGELKYQRMPGPAGTGTVGSGQAPPHPGHPRTLIKSPINPPARPSPTTCGFGPWTHMGLACLWPFAVPHAIAPTFRSSLGLPLAPMHVAWCQSAKTSTSTPSPQASSQAKGRRCVPVRSLALAVGLYPSRGCRSNRDGLPPGLTGLV